MQKVNFLAVRGLFASRLASALLLVLVCITGIAQQAEGATFRVAQLGVRTKDLFINPSSPVSIRLANRYISGPYRFSGRTIPFFAKDAVTGEAKLQAVATIPAGVRQPLVLFRPIPQRLEDGTELPYSAVVIDDSTKAAPLGSMRIFNISAFTLAVRLKGDSPFILAPGQSHLVRNFGRGATDSTIPMLLAGAGDDGQWERIGSAEIAINTEGRYLLFLSPPRLVDVNLLGDREASLFVDRGRIPQPLPDDEIDSE